MIHIGGVVWRKLAELCKASCTPSMDIMRFPWLQTLGLTMRITQPIPRSMYLQNTVTNHEEKPHQIVRLENLLGWDIAISNSLQSVIISVYKEMIASKMEVRLLRRPFWTLPCRLQLKCLSWVSLYLSLKVLFLYQAKQNAFEMANKTKSSGLSLDKAYYSTW